MAATKGVTQLMDENAGYRGWRIVAIEVYGEASIEIIIACCAYL